MKYTVKTLTVFEKLKTFQKRDRIFKSEHANKKVYNLLLPKPPNLFLKVKLQNFANHTTNELNALGIFHLTKWQHTIKNHLELIIDSICLFQTAVGKIAQQQSLHL